MDEGRKLQRGTGFVSPGTRTVFLCVAAVPGGLLVIAALLTGGAHVFAALVIGAILFVLTLLVLLLCGRSFEYMRDKEWRSDPDSLSNAPRSVRLFVIAWIVVSSAIVLVQLLFNGMPWSVILLLVVWNVVSTWLFAHFFAMKIFRLVQGLRNRGKQGL